MGCSNIGVHLLQNQKKKFFYTCISEKVSAYHTGSAFTQHYYVCCVLFVLTAVKRCKQKIYTYRSNKLHCQFFKYQKNFLPGEWKLTYEAVLNSWLSN